MTRDQIVNYLSRRSAEEVEKQAADLLVYDAHALATLQAERESLRAELAEAKRDAELWRAYQARKQAVINAGMARNPLRDAAMAGGE